MPAPRPIAAACVLAAALVGCGGDDEREDPASASTVTPTRERPATEAQATGPVRLRKIGDFASPLYVTAPPGDRRRLFVVEQGGRIRVVRGGRVLRRPFLDVSAQIVSGGEQGLLGLAFAPDYARSRRFYVNFTNRSGDTRIVEYRVPAPTPNRADPASARVLIAQDQPEPNHNGGHLAFGPDRMLYIGLGDGGGGDDQHGERGNAQDLGTILGKLLRIDPRRRQGSRPYAIPSDNPFVDRAGARPEIFAYGLRNPWRFSFDRQTDDLSIGDVGQDQIEEIDFTPLRGAHGANYGWRPFEGNERNFDEPAPGHVPPVLTLTHDDGYCSVTGGYVVRAPDLPDLRGRYVYGDYCDGMIRSARLREGGAEDDRALDLRRVGPISSFGEDARGRVYVTSLEGPVYRITQR